MIININESERVEFISQFDTTEPKTIFILKPLTGFEMMDFTNLEDKNIMLDFIITSIVEIKNCNSDKTEFVKSLSLNILSELLVFITNLNNLTQDDKKKF